MGVHRAAKVHWTFGRGSPLCAARGYPTPARARGRMPCIERELAALTQTAYRALASVDPKIAAAKLDLDAVYTTEFVKKAHARKRG